jgi:hypothetical protein
MNENCLYCNLGIPGVDKPTCLLGIDTCERCTSFEVLVL